MRLPAFPHCFLLVLLRFWFGWILTAPVEAQGGVASCCGWSQLPATAGIVCRSLTGKPAWKIPSEGASLELGF